MGIIIILDLLVTRHVLPTYKNIEVILAVLTVTIGYGVGSLDSVSIY